jgi:MFS family permease
VALSRERCKFLSNFFVLSTKLVTMDDQQSTSDQSQPTVATVPVGTLAQPRRVITTRIDWRKTFSAFRHRNYRLFFYGQLVSLIGTWMQTVAQNWLVYQLTGSALALGFINFVGAIPITLLTLPAGVVADRRSKRHILIATQTASMLLAFVLAALVYFRAVQMWHIAVLSLLLGITNAFDIPARQSLVVDMVGKDDLMNAIALNSSMFNGARVFGPALAGVLVAYIGTAGCFFLNGLSFFAVIVAYMVMRLPAASPANEIRSIWHATWEALRYVAGHRSIRAVLTLIGVTSLFGWSYSVLMPIFARDILRVGAKGYGYLLAANGVGALLGALTLASLGNHPHRRRLIFGGLFGFCATLVVFALSRNAWLSAAAMAGVGWFMIIFFATANTSVQLHTPDELRGRVMGIYALAFLGLNPFGSMLAGSIAHATSASMAILMGVAVCVAAAIIVARLVPPEQSRPSQQPHEGTGAS